ncbi:MAG: hypothetical protein ACM3TN_10945 [Alphaproteobacteria bacterium]|jgi:outer membrane protein assembly factor BamE (lipoprotein component of BamABCDE complex)
MKKLGWTLIVIFGLASLSFLAACAPTLRYGTPPKVDQLAGLKPGVSTAAQVRQALGEPRGYGMARLTVDPTPRTLWYYEYTEASGSRIDLKFLLVFLRQDQYEGHFWFSSANLLEQKR